MFLNTVHALTVILGLMYKPFGKLFHIFQRPANLGVHFYRREAEEGEAQPCRSCGEGFASKMQIDDLKTVLPQVGFDYSIPGTNGGGNWQDTCPQCRRKQVALSQTARETLAWPAAGLSVGLFATTLGFARLLHRD